MKPPVMPSAIPAALVVFGGLLAGCPRGGAEHPRAAAIASFTARIETQGAGGFGAVALAPDGAAVVSFQASGAATLGGEELASPVGGAGVAYLAPEGATTWARSLPRAGAVAIAGDVVVAAIAGSGEVEAGGAKTTLRGDPGAALVGLAVSDGGDRWIRPLGATAWVVVRAITAMPCGAGPGCGDVVAVGSFAGTLRAGDEVVIAAGPSDGFAVRVGPDGAVRWLIRIGGERADAITAVGAAPKPGDGLVVGGTFMGTADARGVPLEAIEPRAIHADGFVARLDDDGAVRWAHPFGGELDDAVAGVAINGGGIVGVAATLRESAVIDSKVVNARGLADAALLTFDDKGHRRAITVLGGNDYDSAAGLAATGDSFVAAVAYSGRITVGDTSLDAQGGDGALLAVLDGSGVARQVLDVAGAGRETVTGVAGVPGGWAATLRHTAGAQVGTEMFGAPKDPYGGSAVLVRGE
jgi:hypothetical protein